MVNYLSEAEVHRIPELLNNGLSVEDVASELHVSKATIRAWIAKLRKAGYKIPKVKPGRKPIRL